MMTIPQYANTTTWKMSFNVGVNNSYLNNAKVNTISTISVYNQTTAITSLEFLYNTGTFSGGTVYVYGVK